MSHFVQKLCLEIVTFKRSWNGKFIRNQKALFLSDFRKKMLKCALLFVHWSFFSLKHHKGVFLLTCVIRMQHTKPKYAIFFSGSKIPRRQSLKCTRLTCTKFFVIFLWHLKQKSHVKLAFQGCSCLAENKCLVMQWLFLDCVLSHLPFASSVLRCIF